MAVPPAVAPAPPPDPGAETLLANHRYNRWSAIVGAVSLSAIQPFIAVLAIRLGATNAQLAAISSLPNLVSIPAVLLGGWLFANVRSKRMGVAGVTLLSRLFFLTVAAAPWAPPAVRVSLLSLCWALAMGPDAAAKTGANILLADLFSGQQRSRALGVRNSVATAAGVIGGLVTGLLLDRMPFPLGYQVTFGAACLLGIVEVALVLRFRESPRPAPAVLAPGPEAWLRPLRHGPYLRFTAASLCFHLAWQAVWPVFSRYQITDLAANNTWISILNIANALGMALAYPYWLWLGERLGSRQAFLWASAGLALIPVLNALSFNLYVMSVMQFLGGAVTGGVILLMLNQLLEVSPAEDRPIFLSVNQALVSATGAVAPLLGGWAMEVWPTRTVLTVGTGVRLIFMMMPFLLLGRLKAGETAGNGK